MNGKELFERLKEVRPNLKVLFVSGHTSDVIAHRGVLNHGVAFLPKPFSPVELAGKVREVLAGHGNVESVSGSVSIGASKAAKGRKLRSESAAYPPMIQRLE